MRLASSAKSSQRGFEPNKSSREEVAKYQASSGALRSHTEPGEANLLWKSSQMVFSHFKDLEFFQPERESPSTFNNRLLVWSCIQDRGRNKH